MTQSRNVSNVHLLLPQNPEDLNESVKPTSWLEKIKNWLVIASFNPFVAFIENSEYPLSRIYRNDLSACVKDVWEILMGKYIIFDTDYAEEGSHIGVLDLHLTPLLFRALLRHAVNHVFHEDNFVASTVPVVVAIAMLVVISYTLELARTLLGCILMLVLLPLIATVYSVTHFKAEKLSKEVRQLNIRLPNFSKNGEISFAQRAEMQAHVNICDSKKYAVIPYKLSESPEVQRLGLFSQEAHPILVADIGITSKNLPGIRAMLALNLFDASLYLRGKYKELVEITKIPEMIRQNVAEGIGGTLSGIKPLLNIINQYAGIEDEEQILDMQSTLPLENIEKLSAHLLTTDSTHTAEKYAYTEMHRLFSHTVFHIQDNQSTVKNHQSLNQGCNQNLGNY